MRHCEKTNANLSIQADRNTHSEKQCRVTLSDSNFGVELLSCYETTFLRSEMYLKILYHIKRLGFVHVGYKPKVFIAISQCLKGDYQITVLLTRVGDLDSSQTRVTNFFDLRLDLTWTKITCDLT